MAVTINLPERTGEGITDIEAAEAAALAAIEAAGTLVTGEGGTIDVREAEALETIAADTQQIAYIDFTTKADGLPPSVMDTGQAVDYTFNASGRTPVISGGRLVVDTPPGSGGLADYYQTDLDAPVVRVGCEWTQPSGADDGNGITTFAAWDGIYEGGGTNVPRSWIHMTVEAGTGATGTAKWWVCNGTGNLFVIKTQTFTNPPADGDTPWVCEAFLEADAGKGYAWLPDGSIMTVTDADIATMCGVLTISVFTFADLSSSFIMCEHFASSGANTAKFCGFKSLFGETATTFPAHYTSKADTPLAAIKRASALRTAIPTPPVSKVYAPTSALSVATTTSAANVDGTNGVVSATAGITGKIIFIVNAYYEWSATDVLFWRMVSGGSTANRVADVGVSGQKRVVSHIIEQTGLTPGTAYTSTLQHWTVSNGSATCKAGGTGGSMLPPLSIVAFPA